MEKLKFFVLIYFVPMAFAIQVFGQDIGSKTNIVQPKIMVIPFTKKGEDIRTVLENDPIKRSAIAKIKNGFDNRGFTTIDFFAKLKEAEDDNQFSSGAQADAKSILIQFSGADIYVEVDISYVNHGRGNSATVLLSAYDAATASSYSSINCDSQEHYDTDNTTLVNAALSVAQAGVNNDESLHYNSANALPCMEDFLNILQKKLAEIAEKGRPVKVNFVLASDATMNFDFKLKSGALLKDAIDDWLQDNSVKENVHLQGSTATALFYDDVRLPLLDPNGNNYSITKFGRKLSEFLQTKGVSADRSIKNGALYITVTN